MPQQISTEEAPTFDDKGIPISQAMVHDDTVYVAGQVALDPSTGEMVEGGVAEQTGQILENIAAILEAAGTAVENTLKTTVFLVDMGDFEVVNDIYGEFFGRPYPARSAIGVAELADEFEVEIEVIAAMN